MLIAESMFKHMTPLHI